MVKDALAKVGAPDDRAESSEEKMALEPFLACTAALQDVHP